MRTFPTTARQRLVALCAVGATAVGALSVPLAHADDLHKKRDHVQHQIKSAGADLDESSARLRKALGALTQARTQLHHARSDLQSARVHFRAARALDHKLQRQLADAEDKLRQAQADQREGAAAVVDQRNHLVDTVTSLYEQGDPQLVGFLSLLNSQTPADLTRANEANSVVLGQQDADLDSLRASEVLLKVRESRLADAEAKVQERRDAAARNLQAKKQYKAQAIAARDRVVGLVHDREKATKMARAAKARDRKQLARLRQQEAHIQHLIQEAIRKARERAAAAAAHHSTTGYTGDTGGFLMRPVTGYITSPYGWRIHPIYHYWGLHDGDDFHAPCGTPLHAAGTGRVLSEYYSSVWGNRLYLNLGMVNGKNVTVIYNHLSRYAVGTGASVARGQVVGYAGTTGWSTACHLHFTVLVNGAAVNPVPWFS